MPGEIRTSVHLRAEVFLCAFPAAAGECFGGECTVHSFANAAFFGLEIDLRVCESLRDVLRRLYKC